MDIIPGRRSLCYGRTAMAPASSAQPGGGGPKKASTPKYWMDGMLQQTVPPMGTPCFMRRHKCQDRKSVDCESFVNASADKC